MTTEPKSICPTCGNLALSPQVETNYQVELGHDGKRYIVTVPNIELFHCTACGAEAFGEDADDAMNAALRQQIGLMQPKEILERRKALGLKQEDLAAYLKIAVGTLSKWENGAQIQQKVMDQFLRVFFDVSECRKYLGAPPSCWSTSLPSRAIEIHSNQMEAVFTHLSSTVRSAISPITRASSEESTRPQPWPNNYRQSSTPAPTIGPRGIHTNMAA